ncbi:hypothetical protein V502_07799 [Pseudogymnoascus sp. VKM F-4520 (FW-2644)]|nr:hypothetical protein V502_07799 [Pseudogymnoascus sp. VKM F-4520 (FW-2644)]
MADTPTQGVAQSNRNISIIALLTAIGTGIAASGVQILIFTLIKNRLVRIYQPKTYLVPERQRTAPPPRSPFGWMVSIFTYKDKEIINKCGLDAYFFLRYLQTQLIIFVPLACLLLPILLPLNYIGGRGTAKADPLNGSTSDPDVPGGLDRLAWGNISPTQTNRYWAHLVLAIVVVIWVCYVFFAELRVYIRVRQDYLTSAEHRLRASATTVLVTAIPDKWLTVEALGGLYDVFPGGIRNIWINRNYDALLEKVRRREGIVSMLEAAETSLIRKCNKAQLKQAEKEEKAMQRKTGHHDSKEERARRAKNAEDAAAAIARGEGVTSGDINQVVHTVEDAIEEGNRRKSRVVEKQTAMGGLAAMGKQFGRGLGLVGKAGGTIVEGTKNVGGTIVGGAKNAGKGFEGQIESTNGFVQIDRSPDMRLNSSHSRSTNNSNSSQTHFAEAVETQINIPPRDVSFGQTPDTPRGFGEHRGVKGPELDNIPYRFGGGDGTNDSDEMKNSWWKFWKGPSGGFASPVPHGFERDEYIQKRNFGQMVTSGGQQIIAPMKTLFTNDEGPQHEYPPHIDPDYVEDEENALWAKYVKKKDRSTHRLPRFGIGILPYIFPWVNTKVDTIYWCREELARLNIEIEYDQEHSEDYPKMNSAFIQFNHQIAAHMAVQAVSHHIPKHMAPRMVEVSPTDVIWGNMSIKWWEAWLRTFFIFAAVAGMCILWAIPVSATALLGNIPELIRQYHWLSFLRGAETALKAVAGILPAVVLALLMILPPLVFYNLATLQGNQTGKLRELSVQNYYFFFLFVQVFLVVSIASGTFATLAGIADVTSIPGLLAQNLPKASNYFFSYMIIQALSTSAGSLLQVGTLIMWILMPKLFDNTARQKWKRNTSLSTVHWGTYFPTYTNFACIAIIYSTVAPLIMVFAIITFTVLWIANRYCMLYVYRHTEDTGGLLYPRAINQTFVGLYVMELCLIGLFFLVRDAENNTACFPQAIIMIVVMALTAIFQFLLNQSFGPLYEHLAITLEDEAVLRDEAFERAQAARLLESDHDDDSEDDIDDGAARNTRAVPDTPVFHDDDIELRKLRTSQSAKSGNGGTFNPLNPLRNGATWAQRGARTLGAATFGDPDTKRARRRRRKDVEAQQLMGEALFGGYNDEIEDLTPDERDALVRVAFQHEALRAKRPNVWLPRDGLGVSDEEVRRTERVGRGNIWITNRGTALDGKGRVMYGRNPPDFEEVSLIML